MNQLGPKVRQRWTAVVSLIASDAVSFTMLDTAHSVRADAYLCRTGHSARLSKTAQNYLRYSRKSPRQPILQALGKVDFSETRLHAV